jgi:hypothetical protein
MLIIDRHEVYMYFNDREIGITFKANDVDTHDTTRLAISKGVANLVTQLKNHPKLRLLHLCGNLQFNINGPLITNLNAYHELTQTYIDHAFNVSDLLPPIEKCLQSALETTMGRVLRHHFSIQFVGMDGKVAIAALEHLNLVVYRLQTANGYEIKLPDSWSQSEIRMNHLCDRFREIGIHALVVDERGYDMDEYDDNGLYVGYDLYDEYEEYYKK